MAGSFHARTREGGSEPILQVRVSESGAGSELSFPIKLIYHTLKLRLKLVSAFSTFVSETMIGT
jgi:hypothetical protein